MDTYMDTSGRSGLPLHSLQFFIGDSIISPKHGGGAVSGDGHDGEVVIAGEPQVVECTVPEIMEGEISKFRCLDRMIPLTLVVPCKVLDRSAPTQKNPSGVEPPGESLEHGPDTGMERDPPFEPGLGFLTPQADEAFSKVDVLPSQLQNLPLAHAEVVGDKCHFP